jgi:hypothetical protein
VKHGFAQKVESIIHTQRITLKAFANSSPGLRFGNPGKSVPFLEGATLKELRRRLLSPQPPSGLRTISSRIFEPRVSKTLG